MHEETPYAGSASVCVRRHRISPDRYRGVVRNTFWKGSTERLISQVNAAMDDEIGRALFDVSRFDRKGFANLEAW